MIEPLSHVSWAGGVLWLAGIAATAFLVSWILSDARPTRRAIYIPILAMVTGAVTAGYLIWSRSGASFWTNRWTSGLLGAGIAAALLSVLLNRRLPHAERRPLSATNIGWDGIVYGAAEGLLLSTLPVLVTWQMLSSNGWTGGLRTVGAGALAIVASIMVIVAHHLGYPEFRGPMMAQAVLGCGILSISYLLTGSVVAPTVAHAVLHAVIVRNGMELPPREKDQTPKPTGEIRLAA